MRNSFVCSFLCFYLCLSVVFGQFSFPVGFLQGSNKVQNVGENEQSYNNYYPGNVRNVRFPNQMFQDQYSGLQRPTSFNQFGLNLNIHRQNGFNHHQEGFNVHQNGFNEHRNVGYDQDPNGFFPSNVYVSNNNPKNQNNNHNENTNHNYDIPKSNFNKNNNRNQNSNRDDMTFENFRQDRHEDSDITHVETHQNIETTTNKILGFQNSAGGGLTELKPIEGLNDRNNFDAFQGSCRTVDGGSGSCLMIFNCATYRGVLMRARSDNAARSLLRNAHCGFEGSLPKVCCPSTDFSTEPPPSNVPFTTSTPEPVTTTTTVSTTTASQSPKEATSTEVPEPPEVDLYDGVLPDPPVCGVSNASWSRVVGGIPAKLGDFPWMALLGYENRQKTIAWRCGGTLITNKHVLSAAHCLHNHDNDLTMIRLGELDLERDDDGATPIDIRIQKKIKHEGYNPKAFTNDIAIIVLEETVAFTHLIKPVCIMKTSQLRSQTYENYRPIIAGWGAIGYRKESAPHLQVLQIPVVSNDFCAQSYASYKSQVIDKRVLCAGYKNGGKDACQGDSGGPLLQPIYDKATSKTFFYQLGVVSYGKECALANFPGVYSRVTYFTSWIHDTVKKTRNL